MTAYPTGGTTASFTAFVTRFMRGGVCCGSVAGSFVTAAVPSLRPVYCGSASANCIACRRLYKPPLRSNSSCVPTSATLPWSKTTMRSAF